MSLITAMASRDRFLGFDQFPTELQVGRSIYMTASFRPTSVHAGKARLRCPTLPFATIPDDSYIAGASQLPKQLLISAQTASDDCEEERSRSC